jgi:hypothetical protein
MVNFKAAPWEQDIETVTRRNSKEDSIRGTGYEDSTSGIGYEEQAETIQPRMDKKLHCSSYSKHVNSLDSRKAGNF